MLLQCTEEVWTIKLLLMPCRVMSRGVGAITLNYIMGQAKEKGVRLLSEFLPNDRNRMMKISYTFAGFREIARRGDLIILENELSLHSALSTIYQAASRKTGSCFRTSSASANCARAFRR